MIQQMLAIWSLVPLPFLNPAWTSGSSQFMYCWSLAHRILSITLLTRTAKLLSHCSLVLLCATHRWQPTRLHCPWDSPGKSTGVGCHFLLQCMKAKSESEVTQSRLTFHNPMDCSLPGSSSHGIFQASVLEWVVTTFSDIYMRHDLITSGIKFLKNYSDWIPKMIFHYGRSMLPLIGSLNFVWLTVIYEKIFVYLQQNSFFS